MSDPNDYHHGSIGLPPLRDFFPCVAEAERKAEERYQRYRSLILEHWPKDRPRIKAKFGTAQVELSIAQAKKAGLVHPHGMYSDLVYRFYETPEEEDVLLIPFLERKAEAEAKRKAKKFKT